MKKIITKKLSNFESTLYGSTLVLLISYASYVLIKESSDLKDAISTNQNKWFGLNLIRDDSAQEWNNMYKKMFNEKGLFYIALTPIIHFFAISYLPKFYTLIILGYSTYLNIQLNSVFGLLISFFISGIFYLLTAFKSNSAIWIGAVLTIIIMSTHTINSYLDGFLNDINEYIVVFFFMLLRTISFCMDKITVQNETKSSTNTFKFIDYLMYIYYPTFLFPGLFISYKNFNEKKQPITFTKAFKIIFYIILSGLMVEIVLRLTSTYMIHEYHDQVINMFTRPSLIMALVLKGVLFTSQYIVFYGIPSVANQLIGIKVTDLPLFCFQMHTNKEMWRYFDTGLYEFIKVYLYIPIGGNKSNQFASIFLSFSFIAIWHGSSYSIVMWSFANCLIVMIETSILKFFFEKNRYILQIDSRTKRCFLCFILSIWQFTIHIVSYFLIDDIESITAIVNRCVFSSLLAATLLLIGYFCNAQLRLDHRELNLGKY